MTNSVREHMLLIPGLLRCIDNNLLRFLDSASAYAEIFIVTEKSFSQEVDLLVDRYDAKAWYAEDLADRYPLYPAHLFRGFDYQWLKFYYALNQALEWEEANGIKFEFIHRIRTDITFPDNFHEFMVLPLEKMDTNNVRMLNFADFFFSGKRDSLPYLLNFTSFYLDFFYNEEKFSEVMKYIDLDQLRETYLNSAQYLGSFPIGIVSDGQTLEEFNMILKNKHPNGVSSVEFVDAVATFYSSLVDSKSMAHFVSLARKASPLIRSIEYKRNFAYYVFAPEHILARFFNFSGIRTYGYNISRFGRLKSSRIAKTPFTQDILQKIDNDDISFLVNTEINWAMEIVYFVESGGDGRKLYMAFANVVLQYQASLDSLQCEVLEKIFGSLVINCSNISSIYRDGAFRAVAHEKGIKLLDWENYYKSAQSLSALQNFDEAQAKIQEGLDNMPNQINLLIIASDIYRASGDLVKSLEYAENLIIYHPGDWNGYCKSAQDLMALKRFDEAQAKVQEGLNRLPNQIYLLQTASDVYRALGNREKSLEYAERLIIHHPGDWNGYGKSAQDLMALKRFDEAQAKIKEGLEKMPNQIRLLVIASDIYRALGNREKSLEYSERLIAHHPGDWNGYAKSAQDLLVLKRFDEARAIIKQGLDRVPNHPGLLAIQNDIDRILSGPEMLAV
jgi:tetratricopeptide (TPR) repeat protein